MVSDIKEKISREETGTEYSTRPLGWAEDQATLVRKAGVTHEEQRSQRLKTKSEVTKRKWVF